MSTGFASNNRIVLLAALVFLCFGGIGARLVYVHSIDREKILAQVGKARRQVSIEKARRGDIVDCHNNLLATSRAAIILAVDPQVIGPEDPVKWPRLAALAGVPYADLVRLCTTKTRGGSAGAAAPAKAKVEAGVPTASAPRSANEAQTVGTPASTLPGAPPVITFGVPAPTLNPEPGTLNSTTATTAAASNITDDDDDDDADTDPRLIRYARIGGEISEDTYAEIKKLNIKGVIGTRVWRRVYPHNQLAAQIIGFVNKEDVPASGIEAHSNHYLFAADGWRESEKDGRHRELAQFRTLEVPGSNGYTVKLSIDSVIQKWAEEELAAIAQKFQPKRATIIISDARDGFLYALANHPAFNLNEYNRAPVDVMKNYAITDQLDPGSTFKIVAAAAALEEQLVTPDTTFDCSAPVVDYKGRRITLMADDHPWPHPLTVAEIISRSSNRGAARLAMRLGEQRFYDYALAFGFGARTGFPFGGEINGLINPPAKWSGIDITRIPAGYSVSATPMQIHCAMAAIASGGELLVPQVITEILRRDDEGKLIALHAHARQVRRRVISPETAATMALLLRGTVSPDGTAARISLPGYEFAGKTGTAQKLIDGRYSNTNHIASFSGFFPATAPRVVITIIVDDADMRHAAALSDTRIPVNAYGSFVAAPSFKNIAEKLIPYLDIKPIRPPVTPLFPPTRPLAEIKN